MATVLITGRACCEGGVGTCICDPSGRMSSLRGPMSSSLGLLFVRVLPAVLVLLLLVVLVGLGALFFVDMLKSCSRSLEGPRTVGGPGDSRPSSRRRKK